MYISKSANVRESRLYFLRYEILSTAIHTRNSNNNFSIIKLLLLAKIGREKLFKYIF